jgi:hypothetical protein
MLDDPRAALDGVTALWDWRRRIFALYAAIRGAADPARAWAEWRRTREALFLDHPQTPLGEGPRRAPTYFAYDPSFRFEVGLAPALDPTPLAIPAGPDGEVTIVPFGSSDGLATALGGELTLYWIAGYGGGVFLPFTDGTSGRETYAGGRYLLDTIKGSDLGTRAGRLVLDFNFAYNPSCAYSDRWICPLAPPANRLPNPVRAGEKRPG